MSGESGLPVLMTSRDLKRELAPVSWLRRSFAPASAAFAQKCLLAPLIALVGEFMERVNMHENFGNINSLNFPPLFPYLAISSINQWRLQLRKHGQRDNSAKM